MNGFFAFILGIAFCITAFVFGAWCFTFGRKSTIKDANNYGHFVVDGKKWQVVAVENKGKLSCKK